MNTTSLRLLSALQRTKSMNALQTTPEDYFDESEQPAFLFIRDFVARHNHWPSPLTIREETGIRLVLPKEPLSYYLDQARQRALYHGLNEPFAAMTDAIREQKPDEFIRLARDCVAMSSGLRGGQASHLVRYEDSLDMVESDYDIAKRTVGLRGVPTGYPYFDEVTDGLQNATMTTIVGRTGRGKTTLALRMAKAARDAGRSVLFLSMEMGVLQLARRSFAMDSLIDPTFLRSGRLSTLVEREMRRQVAMLKDSDLPPFYWLAGNFKKSTDALRAAVEEVEPDLVVADAAYLMKGTSRTKANAKHEMISDVIEDLNELFIAVDRPGLITVQFNRTAIKNNDRGKSNEGNDGEEHAQRNPLAHLALHKIAGSDSIPQNSSYVVGIDQAEPPHQHDQRYAGILKGREGGDEGWWKYNYSFRPPNFEQIMDHRDYERQRNRQESGPDLSYMDAEA